MAVQGTEKHLVAARALVAELSARLNLDASVRLWDGKLYPLGASVKSPLEIVITSPRVLGALLRRPTLDNVIRHYVDKSIDLTGGSLIAFGEQLAGEGHSLKLARFDKRKLAGLLWPFLFVRPDRTADDQGYEGDYIGRRNTARNNRAFVQFHYDLSNEFYALFLDPEMVYTAGYFDDLALSLTQAQTAKLHHICRKLRLKPGDRFLDIGCGWGGLVCFAAKHYGVTALGVTLSEEQVEYAEKKAKAAGLSSKAVFKLSDYKHVTGTYDKIASVGLYEAIGYADIPAYMQKVRGLLAEDGLFLNHSISRRAKKAPGWLPEALRPEQKALSKYIFPGGAIDDLGHTVAAMERAGFEVQDIEALRRHYAHTCKLWCERLTAQRPRAIELVGEEKYRIYVAYLAACSLAGARGTTRLYQTLATRSAKRPPALPLTRADLYS